MLVATWLLACVVARSSAQIWGYLSRMSMCALRVAEEKAFISLLQKARWKFVKMPRKKTILRNILSD